jgi:hypothetical protein
MAVEQELHLRSAPANSNLSSNQYYAVTINSSGNLVLSTAAANMDGILQDKPVANQAGAYAYDGISKAAISASNNVVIGSLLEVDTGSTFKLHASGTAVAKALEANGNPASVVVIAVEILRSNASF